MEFGRDGMKIYDIVKSGDNYLVQTAKYGAYCIMTEEELRNLEKRIEEDKKNRLKQLDIQRDNGWSPMQLKWFHRKCSKVLKTRPICDYCNAIGYCKYLRELMRLIKFQERFAKSQELHEDYDRRRAILLNRLAGCGRARLGRHCKRRFNLFNASPTTEVDSIDIQPNISDFLVKET